MATAIAIQLADSKYGGQIDDISFTAADDTGMSFVNNGKTRVIILNDTTGGTQNVVFVSASDPYGRTTNLSVATSTSGGISFVGPFPIGIWNQANHTVSITIADDTTLYLAALSDI